MKGYHKIVLIAIALCGMAQAQESKIEYGISLGLLTGGEVYISELDESFDLESGLMTHTYVDFFITPKFSIGGFASIAWPNLPLIDDTVNFYEFGIALKPRFFLSDIVTYKPGFNLGYRFITADDIDDIGGVINGLGINITNEFQFNIIDGITPYADLGFITQPAGGNDEFNVTFSLLINFRVGLVFTLK